MVDATGIVTNGLWTSGEEGDGETIYITQLEVSVSVEDISVQVELDSQ